MLNGKILISKHTGQNTGEWMQGGEIHVDGQVRSVGKSLFGGRVYQKGKLIASQEIERTS
jgi:formylmethanofuran dehydrogenase subunit C